MMPGYTISGFASAPRVPFKFDGRILFSAENFEMVHLTLQPGEGMDPHAQPMDVVFFVAGGRGTLAIGEETVEIGENTTVHINAGVSRAWRNTDGEPLKILVCKLLK